MHIYGSGLFTIKSYDTLECVKTHDQVLYAVSTPGIDIILGMDWMEAINPVVNWKSRTWRYSVDINRVSVVPAEQLQIDSAGMGAYAFFPRIAGLDAEIDLPVEYEEFADVFSMEEADKLPELGRRTHAIETGKEEPPWGPMYNLSEKELKVLREYITENVEKGWIRRSASYICTQKGRKFASLRGL